ncbi:dynein regulatory complex protein 9-like [Rhopilema esculentum]|uniref:dynein regulatory complex protein 9-like n=1 Tax=Rhopilema esculentum TaxID=499914 RepID=UPI0031D9870D|eukprot:gene16506-7925_t
MDYKLSALDTIHVSAVLEDCVDQLAILGSIIPVSSENHRGQLVSNDILGLIEGQEELERKYETLVSSKAPKSQELENVSKALQNHTKALSRSFRQATGANDTLQKIQSDRKFLLDILNETLNEIKEEQTFSTLVNAVSEEKRKKTELQDIIIKEEQSRKKVRNLQKQLLEVKKEKEIEVQKRKEMIAHLKDQLQETKAKTSMETKYIKKDAEVRVSCAQKQCQKTESELKEEIEVLKQKVDEEARVNNEIESFLRQHYAMLEEKLEYWMEKYDKDVEAKQHELDVLKANKSHDLARLQELTLKYNEYDKVVMEDRREKEIERKKAEQELEEQRACTKIQSWWRGVMVRRQLGPYSKKKKKKGKKGKKSGKKGGKKKKK